VQYKIIANQNIQISALSFGCSRLGKALYEDNTIRGRRILDSAYEQGINFFDTGPNYCYGDSEKILGEFVKTKRQNIIISTKGGLKLSPGGLLAKPLRPIFKFIRPFLKKSEALKIGHPKRVDFSPKFLNKLLNQSLKRLQTDYIDIYKLHNTDKQILQDERIPPFLEKLKSSGKVRLTGVSVMDIDDMKFCTYLDHIDIIQCPLNYYNYKPSRHTVLERMRDRGIAIIARMPFERGLLTSTNMVNSGYRRGEENNEILKRKNRLIQKYNVSDIQLALWFLKDLGLTDSILFSTFKMAHLKQNIDSYLDNVPSGFSWKNLVSD
jgi:aryl-alcohol dehydrogenase-like predicted oxidoreductase